MILLAVVVTCSRVDGRSSNIALLYPIASLQGEFYFDAPEYVGHLRRGWWTYPEADYMKISGMLTNEVRRDFTFVHPEYLATDKYSIDKGELRLNTENFQEYNVMIIPGGRIIQLASLKKAKEFYDAGGKVIATTLLPTFSTELGKDGEVRAVIDEIFGKGAAKNPTLQTNEKGGMALFIPSPNAELLSKTINEMSPLADVIFPNQPKITSKLGYFSYIHKVRDGKDIYFFGNSSDDAIDTDVYLKGKLKLESWNPHDAKISKLTNVSYEKRGGQVYTKCNLKLAGVHSVFWIGN